MPRKDLLKECHTGEHKANLSPENFKHMFCRVCQNPKCVNSALSKSRWLQRMENQEGRLLVNPVFADPKDPQFKHLAEQGFEDVAKQARAMEIAERRGDWEIPTQADMQELVAEIAEEVLPESSAPAGFQELEVDWETPVKSKSGKRSYTVSLVLGEGQEHWSCTCPGFRFHHQCAHLPIAQNRYHGEQEEAEPLPEPPVVVQAPVRGDPAAWQQMRERGMVPIAQNTRFPSGGLMIDGSPPVAATPEPEVDPWAAPKSKPKTVQVGSKFVLGGKK